MTTSDSAHVLSLLTRMPAERLPTVIAHLTASGDLLGRAVAYGRSYQFDHQPRTLTSALADFDAATGSVPDRSEAARFLAMRALEASLLGHPVGTSRVTRMLADAEDDPERPGTLAGLRAMAYAAGALNDEPQTDVVTALAKVDALPTPPDSTYAALRPAIRNALLVRLAADRRDMSIAPDLAAQAQQMMADPRLGPAEQPAVRLMGIAAEAMAAIQRQDVGAAAAATARMREALQQLPAGDPTVDALRAQLDAAVSQLGAFGPPPASPAR